jgi:hypothetical protein
VGGSGINMKIILLIFDVARSGIDFYEHLFFLSPSSPPPHPPRIERLQLDHDLIIFEANAGNVLDLL